MIEQTNLFNLSYEDDPQLQSIGMFDNGVNPPPRITDMLETPIAEKPDHTEEQSPYFTKEGKCVQRVEFFFEMQRMRVVNRHDPNHPEQINWGALAICPTTGHLMQCFNYGQGWNFVSKATQTAFVSWVTEQHLVEEGASENTAN